MVYECSAHCEYCVQLMAVVLQWQDVISPRLVQEMALDRILNRYLVLALQNCPVGQDSLIKCQAVSGRTNESLFLQRNS